MSILTVPEDQLPSDDEMAARVRKAVADLNAVLKDASMLGLDVSLHVDEIRFGDAPMVVVGRIVRPL